MKIIYVERYHYLTSNRECKLFFESLTCFPGSSIQSFRLSTWITHSHLRIGCNLMGKRDECDYQTV